MKGTLIWDFDGTLVSTAPMWSRCIRNSLSAVMPDHGVDATMFSYMTKMGFPWHAPSQSHIHLNDPPEWWQHMRNVWTRQLSEIGIPKEKAAQAAGRVRMEVLNVENFTLFNDSIPVLKKLKKRGFTNVLFSNNFPELTHIAISLGLGSLFEEFYSSANIGFEKPNKMAYMILLQNLKNLPPVKYMVGDSYDADILGAEAVGIPGILVRNSKQRHRRMAETLTDVLGVIENNDRVLVSGIGPNSLETVV